MKQLHLIAIGIGAVTSAVLGVYIIGELFTRPGGAQAFFTLVAWLAVPLVLTVFAVSSPRVAYPVFVALVGALLIFAVTTIPMARAVWEFENSNGPISLMALVAIMVPLVGLGKELPTKAGWLMLIALGGVFASQALSLLFVGQVTTIGEFSLAILPYLATAGLFLLVGRQSASVEASTP